MSKKEKTGKKTEEIHFELKKDDKKQKYSLLMPDKKSNDFILGYKNDLYVKANRNTYIHSGTISLNIDIIHNMKSGSCKIENNELNPREKYAICKEDDKIKIFKIDLKEE